MDSPWPRVAFLGADAHADAAEAKQRGAEGSGGGRGGGRGSRGEADARALPSN